MYSLCFIVLILTKSGEFARQAPHTLCPPHTLPTILVITSWGMYVEERSVDG